MSAIGFYCDQDKILLYSDGIAGHYRTGEVVTTRRSKIAIVNSHTAVLTMGSYGDVTSGIFSGEGRDFFKQFGPLAAARWASTFLHLGISEIPERERRPFFNIYVGYDLQTNKPSAYKVGYGNKQEFLPESIPIGISTAYYRAVRIEPADSKFTDKIRANLRNGFDAKVSAYNAFTEEVKTHPNYGIEVGGSIFEQYLTPPSLNKNN